MSRITLEHVTIAQEGTVKRLGARKEPLTGRWWVDDSWPDLARFERWLPVRTDIRYGEP